MLKFLRELFTRKEVVHFALELELSDGDRAALYGWPDITVEEAQR